MVEEEKKTGWSKVSTIALISALQGTWNNIRLVIWQPFVVNLGFSMRSLGGFESLTDLTGILAQSIFGSASDAYGRKGFLIAREALTIFAGILFIFARSWNQLFLGVILVGLSMALLPIWDTFLAESADTSKLGFIYSVSRAGNVAAGLAASLAAGFMANTFGYQTVFTAATGFALISLLLVKIVLEETKSKQSESTADLSRILLSIFHAINPPPHLRGFYIAMTVDLFAFGMGLRILNGMLSKAYGFTPSMLGIITAVMMGTMTISQILLGKVIDKAGYRKCLASAQLIACTVLGLIWISKRFEVVLIAKALLGVSASLWFPAMQAWIAKNVDPKERARAIGSYSTFRGLISFPAPFIGGALFDAYGFNTPIIMNLAIGLIDILLILKLIKD
jgi:MFS family permease